CSTMRFGKHRVDAAVSTSASVTSIVRTASGWTRPLRASTTSLRLSIFAVTTTFPIVAVSISASRLVMGLRNLPRLYSQRCASAERQLGLETEKPPAWRWGRAGGWHGRWGSESQRLAHGLLHVVDRQRPADDVAVPADQDQRRHRVDAVVQRQR